MRSSRLLFWGGIDGPASGRSTLRGLTEFVTHSGLLAQPLACKLLIRKTRRDVRVVEGARLESVCRGNSTVGSNPTLSASFLTPTRVPVFREVSGSERKPPLRNLPPLRTRHQ